MNLVPSRARPVLASALLLLGVLPCASVASGPPGDAPEAAGPGDARVMVVTTDSSAYCHTLSDVIDARGALPQDIAELKARGELLCARGEVRGGITRLRRALLMLNKIPAAGEPNHP